MTDNARIKFKTRRFKSFPASRMARIKYRHIVFFSQPIYCVEQRKKVLFRVYVFLSVSGKKHIFFRFESEPFQNIAFFDAVKVFVQHFRHGRAGHERALFRQSAFCKIASRMLGISHIHVGNYINDSSVRLFGQTLVLAAVAGFHMENGNMQSFRGNRRKAGIGVSENKKSIGFYLSHKFI